MIPTRRYKYKVTRETNYSFAAPGEYGRFYEKDTNVYAKNGTLGIMVFKRLKDAEQFIKLERMKREFIKIKKVIPIGRGHTPKHIAAYVNLDEFYDPQRTVATQTPPPGTICYPGVFVCE